nr:IS5 family transposase [Thermus thermophilus]
MSSRRSYPSDLSDAEWALLEPLIPAPKPGGRPAKVPRREIVNAILYVLENGIKWRAMPHDLPHWSTVYHYFRKWQKEGIWEKAVQALARQDREREGRQASPSALVMDSQSVKTTEKRGPRGNDGAKKVKGRKRQILTDTGGRLLKAFVHPANEHDKRGGEALLLGMDLSLWPRVQKLFVDWGYRGLKGLASSLGLELEVVARPYAGVRGVWVREDEEVPEIPREEGFKPLPKRWVVERTFAWLGRNRRLAKDYEQNPRVSEAWVYLGMLRLLVKRLARAA